MHLPARLLLVVEASQPPEGRPVLVRIDEPDVDPRELAQRREGTLQQELELVLEREAVEQELRLECRRRPRIDVKDAMRQAVVELVRSIEDGRNLVPEAELAQLATAAVDRARSLAEAAGTRESFVAGLRQQQGLNAARIASIETQARSAEARTLAISTTTAPVATAVVDAAAPAPTSVAASGATITVSSTGYALRGRTATGIPTAPGVVAVDPAVIPLGTRMTIPGYGEAIAADTGGAVHGNVIDLWFPSTAAGARVGPPHRDDHDPLRPARSL